MFESVLERNLPARQVGRGATLAIGVHAVVFAAALYFSSHPPPVVEKELRTLTMLARPSRITFTEPATTNGGSATTKARAEHRVVRSSSIDSDKTKKRPDEAPSAAMSTGESNRTSGDPGAPSTGPAASGVSLVGEGANTGAAGTTIAIPFGEGMKRPVPVVQSAPLYTREASAAHAEGTVSVRCVITLEGTLKDCRILKGVAHMDAAVLDALSRWKYTPVTFQGRPVSVYYAINLRLVAP